LYEIDFSHTENCIWAWRRFISCM